MTPAQELRNGCRILQLDISARQSQCLIAYVDLLAKWNRAYNLTAVRAPQRMITAHLLDSLAIQPYIHGSRLADIGTGPGVPGIPLAIINPTKRFELLDAGAKKVRFIQQANLELKLDNITAIHTRVQHYRPARLFDTVVCRAFGSLAAFAGDAGHLAAGSGQLLAMKGRWPAQEMLALPADYRIAAVTPLAVPGLDAERHLVRIEARAQAEGG